MASRSIAAAIVSLWNRHVCRWRNEVALEVLIRLIWPSLYSAGYVECLTTYKFLCVLSFHDADTSQMQAASVASLSIVACKTSPNWARLLHLMVRRKLMHGMENVTKSLAPTQPCKLIRNRLVSIKSFLIYHTNIIINFAVLRLSITKVTSSLHSHRTFADR